MGTAARLLGERTAWYKWFGAYYIITFFVLFPLLLFAFSFAIDLGAGGVFLNIILDLLLIAGIVTATWKIDKVAAILKLPAKNELPTDAKSPPAAAVVANEQEPEERACV